MDKDTKVLLMAVVIILVALVSFNLSDLTGKVTSDASIAVTPSKLTFGKYDPMKTVTVNVDLGEKVADAKMYLYMCNPRDVEKKLSYSIPKLCAGSTCRGSSVHSFSVPSGLVDGYYCFKALKGTEEVAKSNRFTVAH